eukprot:jgi/Botrbrau1/21263/Bobra.39_2s0054.1
MSAGSTLEDKAKAKLGECSRILVFDESGKVLFSTFRVLPSELSVLTQCFGDREAAIRAGLILQGKRYEIHRHHPPLVYGRDMSGDPELSDGIAICRVEKGITGIPAFALITYPMPKVSARMVTLLRDFAQEEVQVK